MAMKNFTSLMGNSTTIDQCISTWLIFHWHFRFPEGKSPRPRRKVMLLEEENAKLTIAVAWFLNSAPAGRWAVILL